MLDKNETLDQINKFIVPNSLCFEDNARLDPYFMSYLSNRQSLATKLVIA